MLAASNAGAVPTSARRDEISGDETRGNVGDCMMKSDFEFFVHATLRRSYTDAMTTEPIPQLGTTATEWHAHGGFVCDATL